MHNIYLANNDIDNSGFQENNIEIPVVIEEERLPSLPDVNSEVKNEVNEVPNEEYTESNNQVLTIAGLIFIGIVLLIIIVKQLLKPAKVDNNSGETVSEKINDFSYDVKNKSFATGTNLKKCIRRFLENTKIR